MNTKKLFMLLATMLLSSLGAFAQSGNSEPLKGDVNEDGKVDVADITAVIKIMKENATPQPTYYWYLGLATVDQIQNQSYINGLTYNQTSIKPSELTLPAGYNVFVCPSNWGIPTITDDNGFECESYTADDLGITNPSNKVIFVQSLSASGHININWKRAQQ